MSSQLWSPQTTNLMKSIEGVQRRATLWILGIKCGDLPYVERLKKLELLPLAYDREIRDLLFYYKCRNCLIDLDMGTFTQFVCSRTRQGSSSYLRIPYCKTSTFKMSYFNRLLICGTLSSRYVCNSSRYVCNSSRYVFDYF